MKKVAVLLAEGFETIEALTSVDILRRAGVTCTTLPGGMPGAVNLRDNEKVNEIVKKFYDEGKIVAAICAGPITFGKLGIVNGKNATCYPGFEDQLVGCNYKDELVVVDENIITGRGPAAAIPFAFEILNHILPEKVEQIKKAMLFNS